MIRRFARRPFWDGVCLALFAAALAVGYGSVMSGAQDFLGSLAPGTAAQASDQPGRAGEGVVRLPMFAFAAASRFSPQVLFPVVSHAFPDWLRTPPVALRVSQAPVMGVDSGSGFAYLRPVIAICIDDLGPDLAATDKAMALPQAVALSFLPFARDTPFLAQEAEDKGHTVLAHVPMEALSHSDPGPMALNIGASDIAQRLAWHIARVPGLSGINNHEGSRFTQDAAAFVPVAKTLAAQHLFFFDSRTIATSQAMDVARHFGVSSAGRDIFLDDTVSEAEIRRQLNALVALAKRNGTAIAIGHPHTVTLNVLAGWLAQDHGVELVTLGEAMRRKSQAQTVALASR